MLGRTTDASRIMCACCGRVNMKIVALAAEPVSQFAGEDARATESFLEKLFHSG